jgi:hypothetical protein
MALFEKSFNDCTLVYLEKTFGVEQVSQSPVLTDWLNRAGQVVLSDFEKEDLLLYQDLLRDNILHWNEQELSLHFIGPVLALARFTHAERRFNLFAQRPISANVESLTGQPILLSGKPDGMIASGYREPESPFFCFTEYKKHREPIGEPEGQTLGALLAGQVLNANQPRPMYGCFVIGRDWYFMTLQGCQYAISQDFSAATDDVFRIFAMLKALRAIIVELATG